MPTTGNGAVWVGADPGGRGHFGLALLDARGKAHVCCVDCAEEAVAVVVAQLGTAPAGVGVDAPMWWSSGPSSERAADKWLRKRYGLHPGTVQTANSLRGAALIQGMMFVKRLRDHYPELKVTETHPKAWLRCADQGGWEALTRKLSVIATTTCDHERDAVLSAVAAREAFEGRWTHDLSANRLPHEQDPATSWLGPVHYFWPEF